MTTQALILILTLLALATLAGLVWLAVLGYLLAYLILTALAVVALIGLGLAFGLAYQALAARRQQQAFLDNSQENLSLMQALQSVQNKQNQTLMQQLSALSRPPQSPPANSNFLIEEGVFDELGE